VTPAPPTRKGSKTLRSKLPESARRARAREDWERWSRISDAPRPRSRRALVALGAGFAIVFPFALMVQLVVDFANWVTGSMIVFLFPLGLMNAHLDWTRVGSVVFSLSLIALVAAAIFFAVGEWRERRQAERRWYEDR